MLRPLATLLACLALALALGSCGSGHDSSSSKPAATSSPGSRSSSTVAKVDWPYFGRVPERTHFIADAPDPPFHFLWQFFVKQLIEFPPDLAGNRLYVVNKTGELYALHTANGRVDWKRNLDRDVTGPAYGDGRLYVGQYDGNFVAYDAHSGKPLWRFSPSGHLESSPLVVDGTVYFGDDSGDLYALDAATGKLRWKADAGPAIKASPSYHDGVVYYGDYGGNVHAVRAGDGHQVWEARSAKLGGSGPFYASPAIANGFLFESSTDGTLYALDLSGHERWHFATNAPIYGSPAVATVKGAGPTVFTGSYDHRLYALDAATGKQRWNRGVKGEIPGTPTVVGHTVYTSSFVTRRTTGFDTRTGRPTFLWRSAGYDPVVSDGRNVYLSGFETVFAFDAKRR
jgi:outer membrane protein assembly factor BamB